VWQHVKKRVSSFRSQQKSSIKELRATALPQGVKPNEESHLDNRSSSCDFKRFVKGFNASTHLSTFACKNEKKKSYPIFFPFSFFSSPPTMLYHTHHNIYVAAPIKPSTREQAAVQNENH
jgi:hypothetical protein